MIVSNNQLAVQLLRVLGSNSDLPSYRYSQIDRGVVEATKLYGKKAAADYALRAGVSVRSAIRLIQIGLRG